MQHDLRHFLAHLAGTVAITLVPVVLTAFITMPLSLNRHPGEALPLAADAPAVHMT